MRCARASTAICWPRWCGSWKRGMLTLPATVRIYIAAEPVDLRRGFDGLAAATREIIRQDPLCGHLFAFTNRRVEPSEDSPLGAERVPADLQETGARTVSYAAGSPSGSASRGDGVD